MICKYCGKRIPDGHIGKQCPHCFAVIGDDAPKEAKTTAKTVKKGEK